MPITQRGRARLGILPDFSVSTTCMETPYSWASFENLMIFSLRSI